MEPRTRQAFFITAGRLKMDGNASYERDGVRYTVHPYQRDGHGNVGYALVVTAEDDTEVPHRAFAALDAIGAMQRRAINTTILLGTPSSYATAEFSSLTALNACLARLG